MLKQVKSLYDLGFAIHLIKPKSKMPVKAGWTKGPRDDWKVLEKEYKPQMNVGVRLGRASKVDGHYLAVIDCDVKSKEPKHLIEMEKALNALDLLRAPVVMSGRGNGSRHYYVLTKEPQAPKRVTASNIKVKVKMPSVPAKQKEIEALTTEEIKNGIRLRAAWEISIMGEGQQVVLPPSIHPDSGKPYIWSQAVSGKIPVKDFGNVKTEKKDSNVLKVLEDFKAVDVDLALTDLDAQTIMLIEDGEGCEDRSAALFVVTMKMQKAGLNQKQILSVLTDRKNYLGLVAYEHAKTESRLTAAKWVYKYTYQKAKRETSLENYFDDVVDIDAVKVSRVEGKELSEQTEEIEGAVDWRHLIERNHNDGNPKHTLKNLKLILRNVLENKPYIGRNEFANEDAWLIDTPWGSLKGDVVRDDDTVRIKEWLSRNYRFEPSRDKIDECLIYEATENAYHPVREYLEGLEWDGVPRVTKWLETYLNAEGNQRYLRVVGTKTLLAMVARIYNPGCKFDSVLILEGDQGVGKSSTARILAGDKWFSDSELNLGDKDAVVNMQGVWVYELGELSAMSRFDVNRLKQFISSSTDKIRPPYGKRTISFPRQSILIGTTNNTEYLKDTTGNRRFWPVKISTAELEKLKKDRDQLLAEAKERYLCGEEIWIDDPSVYKIVAQEQGRRVEFDELASQLGTFLSDPPEQFPTGAFTISELYQYATFMSGMRTDKPTQMRIATTLRSIGYESKMRRVRGFQNRFWTKKEGGTTSPK